MRESTILSRGCPKTSSSSSLMIIFYSRQSKFSIFTTKTWLAGRRQISPSCQCQQVLAHRPRDLPQHEQDVPGVVRGGGPPQAHQHAGGGARGPGVRSPQGGSGEDPGPYSILVWPAAGDVDILSHQPRHHHQGQASQLSQLAAASPTECCQCPRQAAQAGRGGPRPAPGCGWSVPAPGQRLGRGAQRGRGRPLRRQQQGEDGADRGPGCQEDVPRCEGAHQDGVTTLDHVPFRRKHLHSLNKIFHTINPRQKNC